MTTRGGFLAATAISTVALAAAPAGAADPVILDEAAFQARIASGARHRQVIFAARVHDGAILQFAVNTLNGFAHWNEPPQNVQIVLVLVGTAATLALDDAAWRTYRLGDVVKRVAGDTLAIDAAGGNPWAHPSATLAATADRSVPALLRRGVRIFVCDTALGDVANRITAAGSSDAPDAFALQRGLRGHVQAGIDIVPAGISAVAVLQEAGYTAFSAAL